MGEPRGDGQLIEDVGNDNVLYLELRSTPRGSAVSGMTPESYVDAVLRGITQSEMAGSKVVTRFLLSINRTEPVYVYVCMCVFRFTTFIAALVLTIVAGVPHDTDKRRTTLLPLRVVSCSPVSMSWEWRCLAIHRFVACTAPYTTRSFMSMLSLSCLCGEQKGDLSVLFPVLE